MVLRAYKNPVAAWFVFLLCLIVLSTIIEYRLKVDVNIIVVSISVISATCGYFITHFLENERKRRERKVDLYRQFVLQLRVFIMGSIGREDTVKKFEDTYYQSWLFISTTVYKRLVKYIEQYAIWTNDTSNVQSYKKLNDKLAALMQAVRDEITIDTKVTFKPFGMSPKNAEKQEAAKKGDLKKYACDM